MLFILLKSCLLHAVQFWFSCCGDFPSLFWLEQQFLSLSLLLSFQIESYCRVQEFPRKFLVYVTIEIGVFIFIRSTSSIFVLTLSLAFIYNSVVSSLRRFHRRPPEASVSSLWLSVLGLLPSNPYLFSRTCDGSTAAWSTGFPTKTDS